MRWSRADVVLLAVVTFLAALPAGAGLASEEVGLVKDIDLSGASALPQGMVNVNGTLYFRATDRVNGEELWKSDGTAAGTVLVKDIFPGARGSLPTGLTNVNGTLYFRATDGVNGEELWKSDGTAAGTVLVKNIYPGDYGSSLESLTNVNGTLFFTANDGVRGTELWKSDGTAAGTVLVKDIFTGWPSSLPASLTPFKGALFFAAYSDTGRELWRSDGTDAGTYLVREINLNSPGSAHPVLLTNVNGTLFFVAEDGRTGAELWKTDGTFSGTVLVKDILPGSVGSSPSGLVDVNGTLYFNANDGAKGTELWKSDGTAAGTVLVKDINPGWGYADVASLTNVNGTLYFTAKDGVTGVELWKSDGTAEGTVLVKDIRPGATGALPQELKNINGTLYFTAAVSSTEWGLWKSDGTAAGTVLVRAVQSFPGSRFSLSLTEVGGIPYFSANDGVTGLELWKGDGTATGTVLVKDIFPGSNGSAPSYLVNLNGTVYFRATDGVAGSELWKSDGTAAGTVLVKDVYPGADFGYPSWLTEVNGTLFFSARDGVTGEELWKSNGTAAGTVLVKDIFPGARHSSPLYLTNVNGTLFFLADSGSNTLELWKSNGTDFGTVRLRGASPNTFLNPRSLTNVNGTLFFSAATNGNAWGLWKSDGTAAGTVLVKSYPNPGTGTSGPDYLTNVNGTLFFSAADTERGFELWKSDGTAAGTVLVRDIVPGPDDSAPMNLMNVNGTLFFSASDGVTGFELWKSDGTAAGTVLVRDISPGASHSSPAPLMGANGTLYFQATQAATGRELWKSDGTAAGTVLVKDIFPGAGSASPRVLANVNGTLYLSATDGVHGVELWKSDGTAAGTVLHQDFFPGPSDGNPSVMVSVGVRQLFAATSLLEGEELWVLGVDRTPPTVTCPADLRVLATSASGTPVTYPAATATDDQTASPRLTYSAASGSLFALGRTAVTVTATDDTGNTARCGFTIEVVPAPPTLSAPADGAFTRAPVSVAGTALAGATVSAWEDTTVLDVFVTDANGAFSSALALAPGVHALRFTQTREGITSEPTAVRTVTVHPPAPVLTRPAQGASVVGPTVRVEGTGLAGATLQLREGTTSLGNYPVTAEGTFSANLSLAYGAHRLSAIQTAGGQPSPSSEAVSFEVRPAAPDVSAPGSGSVLDGPAVAVTGSGVPQARVEVREGSTVLVTLVVGSTGSFSGQVELAPGTHSLTFVQKAGGATSDVLGPRSVSVRPPAPVLTAPAAQARVPGPDVLLEGTARAGARVSVEASGVSLGDVLADSGGAFRLRVTRPYGPQTVSLQQTVESVSGPARLAEFTVIPASPVLSQPLDGATVGREVEVRGGGVALARVTLREGTGVLATADADANGAFVMNVTLPHGPHTLTAVQRVQGQESDASAPVHLQAVFNRAPVADAQELSVAEDGRLGVTLTANDADGDPLVFTVRTPPAHGALEGTPPALTYVPGADFHGADRFTFAVSDGSLEATATVKFTVTPVNDTPVATALTATTGEGQPVPLTLSGTDVDGDRLAYEVVTGPAHGRLQGTPPEVTYTPVVGFAGMDAFTFRVSDGQQASPPATVSLRVVASTLTVSVSDLQPLEGSAVTFSAALADASATPVFAWDFGDGTQSSEPTPRHVFPDDGVYTVRVSATDADGTRQASLLVTVRNAPPVVESFWLPEGVSEAQQVELSATALDPAGSADTLEYVWNFGDGSPEARGERVRHAFRDDGAFSVVLTVRDEDGGEVRAQATLLVANVPPSATTPERQTLQVGESLSLTLSARDVARAADPLTWKKLSGPGAVTPEGLFTWVPTVQEVGESSVQLEVSDDDGGCAEVTLVVEVLPPNAVAPTGYGCGASGGTSGLFALLSGLLMASRRRSSGWRG